VTLPDVSRIEAGTSILFLGAGFSAEAMNIHDEKIKDVSNLTMFLLEEVGINSADSYDLESAAEEYQLTHGREGPEKIAKALHSNFRSKSVTVEQRIIVCQP
jgi:hypothetical protein